MADAALTQAVWARTLKLVLEEFAPSVETLFERDAPLAGVTHEVLLHLRDGRSLLLRVSADFQVSDAEAEVF